MDFLNIFENKILFFAIFSEPFLSKSGGALKAKCTHGKVNFRIENPRYLISGMK